LGQERTVARLRSVERKLLPLEDLLDGKGKEGDGWGAETKGGMKKEQKRERIRPGQVDFETQVHSTFVSSLLLPSSPAPTSVDSKSIPTSGLGFLKENYT